jgi:hypothetical protein
MPPLLTVVLSPEPGLYHGSCGSVSKFSVMRVGPSYGAAVGLGATLAVGWGRGAAVASDGGVGVATANVALGSSVAVGGGSVAAAVGESATEAVATGSVGASVAEALLFDTGSPHAAPARTATRSSVTTPRG